MTPLRPHVTVVMPVYNASPFLGQALESILTQSYSDFELLCVDDASTDDSCGILREFAKRDSRVRILENERNMGIAKTLNRALEACETDLVARMDADDISLPERLAKQVQYMVTHPEVGVLSAHCRSLEDDTLVFAKPLTDESIRARLLWECAICHPATIFRKQVIQAVGGYHSLMVPAEDYDLWTRLAADTDCKFANLDEPLLLYRTHPTQARVQYFQKQREKAEAVLFTYLQVLGITEEKMDRSAHLAMCGYPTDERIMSRRVASWGQVLLTYNQKSHFFDHGALQTEIRRRSSFAHVLWQNTPLGLKRILPSNVKHLLKKILGRH